jgi:hypothetical protein
MKNILLGAILLFSMLSCTTEDSWNGPTPYCLTITGKFITKTCNGTTVSSGSSGSVVYCIGKSDINYILLLNRNNVRVYVTKQEYDTYNQGNLYCKYN